MKVKARAKVNLALDVLNKREDGYHDLDMIMAPCALYDELEIEPVSGDADLIVCTDEELPEHNTLSKTMALLRSQFPLSSFYTITLHKGIPSQAGLGGASADAAALLKAINELEGLGLSQKQLMELGAQIGADVPFCVFDAPARVKGTGDVITPIETGWKIPVLLVKPDKGVSTPQAFALADAEERKPLDIDIVQAALEKEDIALLYQTMDNALEDVAEQLVPVLGCIRDDLNDAGIVRVMMTGSGSTMMGFSVDEDVMEEACRKLSERYPFVCLTVIG